MNAVSEPYWPPPPERYPGVLPEKADVLIIGGGITGVSLLHHLARRRIAAVLVERSRLASGASGRNAGFLLAGVAASYAEAVRQFGREKAREVWAVTEENHDLVIEAARGQDVGHRRLGSAILASGEGELAQLTESAQLLSDDGFVARLEGDRLINPRDGEVDPAALVAAIARQATARAIREGVEVTAIEPRRRDVAVHAGDATCHAGAVILATNAYTSLLAPEVKISPVRAQMLALAPVNEVICDRPTYSHFGYRYWRQLQTGEFLIGGWRDTALETEVGIEASPTTEIQRHLDRAAQELGAGADVTHRWAGIMGFTASGLPLAGPVAGMPNVYVCGGYNGHGMGFSFVTARQVAGQL